MTNSYEPLRSGLQTNIKNILKGFEKHYERFAKFARLYWLNKIVFWYIVAFYMEAKYLPIFPRTFILWDKSSGGEIITKIVV